MATITTFPQITELQTTNKRLQRLMKTLAGKDVKWLTPTVTTEHLESELDNLSNVAFSRLLKNIAEYDDVSGVMQTYNGHFYRSCNVWFTFGNTAELETTIRENSENPDFYNDVNGIMFCNPAPNVPRLSVNIVSSDGGNVCSCSVCHRYAWRDYSTCTFGYNGKTCGRRTHKECTSDLSLCRCAKHSHIDNNEYVDKLPNRKGRFTFGLEVEVDGTLTYRQNEKILTSPLIAGHDRDGSLRGARYEYHTQPCDMGDVDELVKVINNIKPRKPQKRAGGHMHISRGKNQTAARWYWALKAFTNDYETRKLGLALNMRHVYDYASHDDASHSAYWCTLRHGDYDGKNTAINDSHPDTIELRTFGYWSAETSEKLPSAVAWVHTMWRFFEHSRGLLKHADIMRYSLMVARDVLKDRKKNGPEALKERLAERRRIREAEKARRIAAMRKHVAENIEASKNARYSKTPQALEIARLAYMRHVDGRQIRRDSIRSAMERSLTMGWSDTIFSFVKLSRLDVMRKMVRAQSDLTCTNFLVSVKNPVTGECLVRYRFSFDERQLLGRLRDWRLRSELIKNRALPKYSDKTIARIAVRAGLIDPSQRVALAY